MSFYTIAQVQTGFQSKFKTGLHLWVKYYSRSFRLAPRLQTHSVGIINEVAKYGNLINKAYRVQ